MTEHRCLLVFVLEASGTEICGEEAPHSENYLKTSVRSNVSAETKNPRREGIWQEVSQQGKGEESGPGREFRRKS